MSLATIELPQQFHHAVEHWRRHYIPDFDALMAAWDRYFPKDEPFCLCAKLELGTSEVVTIGDHAGEKKRLKPDELTEAEAKQLLAIIRAQASTEFGSIQQHHGTLARAQDDEDRFWILRVMAEELRHGYQMFHLLLSEDWSGASGGTKGEDMVEEALSMQTGSHVLDAFNLDFDSFLDSLVFAAVIDRVGKYQLTMQKVCAYKPFADSMPPMLREEAFHLAAGVVPLRRWVKRAAKGDSLNTMEAVQRAIAKWYPRGLEMFGDERGGKTNVGYGFKDMENRPAQDLYIAELERMLRDLNIRFIRARHPEWSAEQAELALDTLHQERVKVDGLRFEELLRLPDRRFFRRKGEPAWTMVGFDGEAFDDVEAYLPHLARHLPEAYLASRDMRLYANTLRKVVSGQLTAAEATKAMPKLKRVGGVCPCSRAVRWVVEDETSELKDAPSP
ncbi:MAG: phenylacetate-CoA oxygenase subunit PaaI [Candidatus Kerfeldbacteria bacterium]|nr:phenylacetate-CoA oxygenase subunit PaaI [Candidatus Kerfeldbacteria bacterium]